MRTKIFVNLKPPGNEAAEESWKFLLSPHYWIASRPSKFWLGRGPNLCSFNGRYSSFRCNLLSSSIHNRSWFSYSNIPFLWTIWNWHYRMISPYVENLFPSDAVPILRTTMQLMVIESGINLLVSDVFVENNYIDVIHSEEHD